VLFFGHEIVSVNKCSDSERGGGNYMSKCETTHGPMKRMWSVLSFVNTFNKENEPQEVAGEPEVSRTKRSA
jgi:hypothetical protein